MSTIQDFNINVNLLEAILWQYNEAEHLIKIVDNDNEWYKYNVSGFLNQWYYDVFNVDTVTEFGLSVWAKILDINFSKKLPDRTDSNIFGFGAFRKNFRNGNFAPPEDEIYQLSLVQKRLIIKLTYQKYNILPSVPEINKIIRALINQDSYIADGFDMTNNVIILKEQIPREIQFVLDNFDVLPRPAGVQIKTRVLTGREFGFGSNRNNFNSTAFFGKNL